MFEQYVARWPVPRLRLGLSRREAFARGSMLSKIFEQGWDWELAALIPPLPSVNAGRWVWSVHVSLHVLAIVAANTTPLGAPGASRTSRKPRISRQSRARL